MLNRIGNRYLAISNNRFIAISSRIYWRRESLWSCSRSYLVCKTWIVSGYTRLKRWTMMEDWHWEAAACYYVSQFWFSWTCFISLPFDRRYYLFFMSFLTVFKDYPKAAVSVFYCLFAETKNMVFNPSSPNKMVSKDMIYRKKQ